MGDAQDTALVKKPIETSVYRLADDVEMKEVIAILHSEAGIDYDRPIFRNAHPALLYEEALKYEEGTAITSSGALATSSGSKTGRSPKDKRVVDEPSTNNEVWWGIFNFSFKFQLYLSSCFSFANVLLLFI